ncbi:DNA polymerase III epsilon subunit [invertebrate metagenome]|uniref:DNA polymerase III subunit epsilon n=1 Tax=invertebrate metagenome TaxID=1711999 RepID=A0A484HCK8_9ZZZZ
MREVVLDTETTGLNPADGHRVVEIGCIELVNHIPTGNHRQWYINPERDVPADAKAIHGLSSTFLASQPLFSDIAESFLAFLCDATLIIHNAAFDIKFLNTELQRCGLPSLSMSRVVDTVAMARRRFPGAQVSLDSLCRRFSIDNSSRTVHGALLDSQLLAAIYLELIGGREPKLTLAIPKVAVVTTAVVDRPYRPARSHTASPEELEAHVELVSTLKNPLWEQ